MSSSGDSARDSTNELIDQVVADYVRAVETGDPPDREQLLAAHPVIADDLRDFFRHRDRMEKLLDPLRSAAGRALNVRCPHCHNSIELVDHVQVTDLCCHSCGSSFSLVATGSTGRFPGGMQRIGQFQLVEQVGVGQFGSVWKARDLTLERTVAIKIPRSGQLREAEAEMFLRDARLSAQLHHPNIVSVHEVGKLHDTIYIVSDFIQGASLKEWNAVKRLSPNEASRLCMKVAGALHHAHEAGIVHRDLKPGNVMMDLTGEPHLVDFGLAKRDGGEITMTLEGQILGTPAYMSPEQARGEGHGVDRRADIYSLGVILFELLTGELPFRGDKQMLIVQIIKDDPPSPRSLNANMPRDLETICLKCLRKEPAKRYPTAAALANDLQCWLERKPIVARPVRRAEKMWLWCRRRPAISSLLAILALVITAAVFAFQEIKTRERARTSVHALLHASSGDVLETLEGMAPLNRHVMPMLQNRLHGDLTDKQRLRVALARLQYDGSQARYLCDALLASDPQSLLLIRKALTTFCDAQALSPYIADFWKTMDNADEPAATRLRAAGALAHFCPKDPRWKTLSHDVAAHLVTQPIEEISDWLTVFQPVSQDLEPALQELIASDQIEARNMATTALARYLANDPVKLMHAIEQADPNHLSELVQKLRNHSNAISLLRERLESNGFSRSGEQNPTHAFSTRSTTVVKTIEAADGIIYNEFALCPKLPLDQIVPVTEQLRDYGYRPIRLRPFQTHNLLAAAVLWTRDHVDWRLDLDLTEQELHEKANQWRGESFIPVDVADYFSGGDWRCAAVWEADAQADTTEVVLSVLREHGQWERECDTYLANGFVPQTIQIGIGNQSLRLCQIWRKPAPRSYRLQKSSTTQPRGASTEQSGLLLMDVTVYPKDSATEYGGVWHQDFGYLYRVEQTSMEIFQSNCHKMAADGFTPVSVDVTTDRADRPVVASLWHRPIDLSVKQDGNRNRQSNLVIAMMMLGELQPTVDRMRHRADPAMRTLLMQQIPAAQVDPLLLIRILENASVSPDVRQALILCLGNYGHALSPSQRRLLVPRIRKVYLDDINGGVHAAAEWLLRKWNVAFEEPIASDALPTEPGSWFQDKAGNTLIVAKLPDEPPVNWARSLRLDSAAGRVLAVSTKEVTVAQFRRCFPDYEFARDSNPDSPANNLSWFDAVAYCHHLNLLHGIDESQWCYLPNDDNEFFQGMRIPRDFASRSGYRLQTTLEFRHSSCAGAVTRFFFGDDPDLLSPFAWHAGNTLEMRPVGTRMPNVLGLFDVHGNVMEWCYGGPHDEGMNDHDFVKLSARRAVIGGHFNDSSSRLGIYLAQHAVDGNLREIVHGFRVARTLVPARESHPPIDEAERDWETAYWVGRQGKWHDAAKLMQEALPYRAENPGSWQCLPRIWLFLGEFEKANAVCDEMLRRFGDTQDPDVAHLLAGMCLSIPDREPTGQVERLIQLALQANNLTHYRDMGMLLYRLGKFEEAEPWLQKATYDYRRAKPATYYFLAMTLHQLGDGAGARHAFEEALRFRDEVRQGFSVGDYGEYWHHWLVTEAIRREAEQVLGID